MSIPAPHWGKGCPQKGDQRSTYKISHQSIMKSLSDLPPSDFGNICRFLSCHIRKQQWTPNCADTHFKQKNGDCLLQLKTSVLQFSLILAEQYIDSAVIMHPKGMRFEPSWACRLLFLPLCVGQGLCVILSQKLVFAVGRPPACLLDQQALIAIRYYLFSSYSCRAYRTTFRR